MLAKLVKQNELLTYVEIDGVKRKVRWEVDTSGKAVLGTADVSGLAYNKDRDLSKTEITKNMDVFYSDFEIAASGTKYVTFAGLPSIDTINLDFSEYRSFDLVIRSLVAHDFSFSDASGFRTIDLQFGEFSFSGTPPSIKQIADIAYKNSSESNSDGNRHLVIVNARIVQSVFRAHIINGTTTAQNYHAELRLYR